jgi:acyl dehydratase
MGQMYFEDVVVGETIDLGTYDVSEAEIVEFAERYDPQSFHVDAEAAAESMFGERIASGWHTAAMTMRLLVDGLLADVAVVGAVGIDDLRWRKPVVDGDTLTASVTVTEKDEWDGEKGRVDFAVETVNQDDETVLSRTDLVLVEKRP